MSQVKQILLMHKQGHKKKQIARNLSISKNTVKTYLEKYLSLKYSLDELLKMEDPLLEAKFHAGNPSYKDNSRYETFKLKLDYFAKELKKTGVTRQLLWEEYRLENAGGYGYTQFCHHLTQQLIARKPSMVVPHKAAETLYVDFAGKKMSYVDKETGEMIWCPVFVACLPYSDYAYAIAVRSQGIDEFIFALRSCLEFLGGVPRIIVPDNLKSAVVKANNYEPGINHVLEDFCNHYGTAVVPTRVSAPQDKALVENQVKTVYTRVYAKLRNTTFFSLDELNRGIMEKVIQHNQTRMQQKPYCREEKFLSDEKPLLSDLPKEPFETKYYREYKVMKNNHVYLAQDKHYYSVPYKWIGQPAKVIYTRTMVRIYIKGELVACHQRSRAPGQYTTVTEHLCSHHQHYLKRSPEYYKEKASKTSETLYKIIDTLFKGGRHPEQNYRSCDGLFSLYRKTDNQIFNKACEIALECGHCSYKFVMQTIENLKKMPKTQVEQTSKPLPSHKNIRGGEYYKQTTLNFLNNESN